jgi:hypothetical protein
MAVFHLGTDGSKRSILIGKSEELIRDTKSSYEKIRQELDQIQKTPLPQIPQVPQVPDGNGEIL